MQLPAEWRRRVVDIAGGRAGYVAAAMSGVVRAREAGLGPPDLTTIAPVPLRRPGGPAIEPAIA